MLKRAYGSCFRNYTPRTTAAFSDTMQRWHVFSDSQRTRIVMYFRRLYLASPSLSLRPLKMQLARYMIFPKASLPSTELKSQLSMARTDSSKSRSRGMVPAGVRASPKGKLQPQRKATQNWGCPRHGEVPELFVQSDSTIFVLQLDVLKSEV